MMRALSTTFIPVDGHPTKVVRNWTYTDDDPVVLASPTIFTPCDDPAVPAPAAAPTPVAVEPGAEPVVVVKDRRRGRPPRGGWEA